MSTYPQVRAYVESHYPDFIAVDLGKSYSGVCCGFCGAPREEYFRFHLIQRSELPSRIVDVCTDVDACALRAAVAT